LHTENQKVLDRIMAQKASINYVDLRKHEKYHKKLKRNIQNQFASTKHGYVARGGDSFVPPSYRESYREQSQ